MRIEGAKAIKSRLAMRKLRYFATIKGRIAAKPSKNGRQEGWRLAVKNGRKRAGILLPYKRR